MKYEGKKIWQLSRNAIFIIAFGILLYEACENFGSLVSGVKWLLKGLTPLFIALVIVFLANMLLSLLEEKLLRKWKKVKPKRVICTAFSLLVLLAVLSVFILLIGPRLVESIELLASNFDLYRDSLSAWANDLFVRLELSEDLVNHITILSQKALLELYDFLGSALTASLKTTISIAGWLFKTLLAFFFSFYILYNKETMTRQAKKMVRALFSKRAANKILSVCSQSYATLRLYFRGVIIDCSILGILCFICMTIFNFPFAMLISTMVGVTQIVPFLGPWISTAIGAILILMVKPIMALWFIVMIFAIQQFEGNVIYPRIIGGFMGVSGFWVLLAVVLGGNFFGLLGVLLGVPVMAIFYTIISVWVNQRVETRNAHPQEPAPAE